MGLKTRQDKNSGFCDDVGECLMVGMVRQNYCCHVHRIVMLCLSVLNRESNAGIPGVWVYRIGNVRVVEEPNPQNLIPDPAGSGRYIVPCE